MKPAWPMGSRSQVKQDQFVWTVLDGKTNGTWLEIGAGHPINGNNTHHLEQHFGWHGISIDIEDYSLLWKDTRRTLLTVADALDFDYTNLLPHCDYLQIDVDLAQQALAILEKLVPVHCFSVITFEHDAYTGTSDNLHARMRSRQILEHAGYRCVVPDVALLTSMIPQHTLDRYPGTVFSFEDWWINPNFVSPTSLEPFHCVGVGPNYINDIFTKDLQT
jgi:hypothetical protein